MFSRGVARCSLPRYYAAMKRGQSRLTAQGQISVPAEVRRRLSLVAGSVLEWDVEEDRVTIRRVGRHSFEDVSKALFPREPPAHPLEDLDDGIREHMRSRYASG